MASQNVMNQQKGNSKGGYQVPEGYFSSLKQSLYDIPKDLNQLTHAGFQVDDDFFNDLRSELHSIAEEKNPAHGGFAIPDGYFKQNADELCKIAETQPETKVISFNNWKTIVPAVVAVAAAIALLFTLDYGQQERLNFNQIESAVLTAYIEDQAISTETSSLIYELYESSDSLIDINIESGVSDIELQDYLLNTTDLPEIFTE
jgi:hypothetical protein